MGTDPIDRVGGKRNHAPTTQDSNSEIQAPWFLQGDPLRFPPGSCLSNHPAVRTCVLRPAAFLTGLLLTTGQAFRQPIVYRFSAAVNVRIHGTLRMGPTSKRGQVPFDISAKAGYTAPVLFTAALTAFRRSSGQLVRVPMDPYTLVVIARTQSPARQLRGILDPAQYVIRWVPSTGQALAMDLDVSLIIFDAPPSGGRRSVAWLKRRFAAPVLVLARAEGDPLPAADATLCHPFPTDKLIARIQTTLMTCTPDIMQVPGMSLDTKTHRLQVGGSLHQLRPTGSQILSVLMARAGKAVPRDELFRLVWRTEEGDSTRALDVHISHLRRVVERTPRYPQIIVTVRGVGYRLEPPAV